LDKGSNLPHPDTPIILLGGKPDFFHGVFNIHSIVPIILLSPNYNQNNKNLLVTFTLVPSMSLLSLLVVLLGTLQNPLTFVQCAKEKMDDGGKMLTQIKCKPLSSLIILHHCALSSLLSFWQCLTIVQAN
jgi:hypothetical protein